MLQNLQTSVLIHSLWVLFVAMSTCWGTREAEMGQCQQYRFTVKASVAATLTKIRCAVFWADVFHSTKLNLSILNQVHLVLHAFLWWYKCSCASVVPVDNCCQAGSQICNSVVLCSSIKSWQRKINVELALDCCGVISDKRCLLVKHHQHGSSWQ